MTNNAKLPAHLEGLKIKRHARHGRYVMIAIEQVQPGDSLDFARFVARHEHVRDDASINPNTWDIELDNGNSYIETRGAQVRVWVDEAAIINANNE